MDYENLLSQAQTLANGMAARGLLPGDIIVLGNLPSLEKIVALWGCSLGGYKAFPLNIRYPQRKLIQLLDELNPNLCISTQDLGNHPTAIFSDLISAETSRAAPIASIFDSELAATLLMTSGSAGIAKIVQHSHLNHIRSALGSNHNIPLNSSSRWFLALPLYHIGGLAILYRSVLAGAAVIIPNDDATLVESIQSHQVTHVSLVATQFKRALETTNAANILRRLDAILLGGSEIPNSLIAKAITEKLPIFLSYGSTEMASQITTTRPNKINPASVNSGLLLNDRDLIISHEGEILVKGSTLAQGYLVGKSVIDFRDSEGWFHTGDVGYMDVQGSLTVTGRMDNQFVSGGENIQPEHIESTLCRLAGIFHALVLPKPDLEFGARPVAYIQLEKQRLTALEIGSFLRKSLPGYMIPVAFFQIPGELLDKGLKISRHELAEYISHENNHLQTVE